MNTFYYDLFILLSLLLTTYKFAPPAICAIYFIFEPLGPIKALTKFEGINIQAYNFDFFY